MLLRIAAYYPNDDGLLSITFNTHTVMMEVTALGEVVRCLGLAIQPSDAQGQALPIEMKATHLSIDSTKQLEQQLKE